MSCTYKKFQEHLYQKSFSYQIGKYWKTETSNYKNSRINSQGCWICCWGVLHHLHQPDPEKKRRRSWQVKMLRSDDDSRRDSNVVVQIFHSQAHMLQQQKIAIICLEPKLLFIHLISSMLLVQISTHSLPEEKMELLDMKINLNITTSGIFVHNVGWLDMKIKFD